MGCCQQRSQPDRTDLRYQPVRSKFSSTTWQMTLLGQPTQLFPWPRMKRRIIRPKLAFTSVGTASSCQTSQMSRRDATTRILVARDTCSTKCVSYRTRNRKCRGSALRNSIAVLLDHR